MIQLLLTASVIIFGLKFIHDEIIPKSNKVTMSLTISWLHAVVTGVGAIYVQLTEPSLFASVEKRCGKK